MADDPGSGRMVAKAACRLLREAYFGPAERGTWFTNHGPEAGILATLARVDAARASRSLRSEAPSIAAHTEHLRWSLEQVRRTLEGHPWQPDWSASWSVQRVEEGEWQGLRQALREEVEAVLEKVDRLEEWPDPMMLTGVLATVPHAAHHLGSIREMERQITEDDS